MTLLRLLGVALSLFVTFVPAGNAQSSDVSVGSKKFTENVILGEMVRHLGTVNELKVTHRKQLGGTRFLWSALTNDEIQVYPDYTGTLRKEIFAGRTLKDLNALREALASYNVKMTEPLGFNNTYALAMTRTKARKLNIDTISDLKKHPDLTLGFTNEFMDRADGWPGLRDAYQLPHDDVQGLDHDLAYQGLASGDIDVIDAYTTDANIEYHDLKLLKDDLNYFPTYQAVFLYREELNSRAPQLVKQLKRLEESISQSEMRSLNARVKLEEIPAKAVAANFLESELNLSVVTNRVSQWRTFLRRTYEHLFLVIVSLTAAILLAVPLGIIAYHGEAFGQVILGLVGILQTIPSIAMLVFMIPLFGIGTKPAMAALFLYSLLPVVRNTYSGLQEIPQDILDSARGLGLGKWSILFEIKLPLALRSILAGIKTSAVINVGIATLGALIGAGGYGQPIFTGIRLDDMTLVLQGAVPAALLALVVQWFFDLIEYFAIPEGLKQSS
ncbi:MAG: glycine betaine ABC transporter substrate-binding protein [bacterium]